MSTLGVETNTVAALPAALTTPEASAPPATPAGPATPRGLSCARARDQRAEVLEHGRGVLEVLDRLQEHDRIGRLGERLDEVTREAQVGAAVAQPRVLVSLGVGVHADDLCGGVSEHVRAIALAAGHVDHAQSLHARGDPLIHREVAAKPVVLGGHVGERALAGELQRRDAVRLIALGVARHGHGARVYGADPCHPL